MKIIRFAGVATAIALAATFLVAPQVSYASTPSTASIDTNAWYTLSPRVSGLRVDVRLGGTSNGTRVQQHSANTTNSQQFRFVSNGDGTFRVYSRLSNSQVFDVAGGATSNGAKVQTWKWDKVNQQKWQVLNATAAGFVTFKPKHATSRCLDVPNASKSSGVQLQIYSCNNTSSQQFTLKKVGQVYPVAGACNAFATAKTMGTYLVAGWLLPVCGPRPDFDTTVSGRTTAVYPYKSAPTYHPGYQCAELSARWLHHRYKVASIVANGAQVVDLYASTYSSTFTKVANGTANKAPRAGDVISFSTRSSFSDVGHVGVVISSSVNSSGNGSIVVAEQNNGGSANGKVTYVVTSWKVKAPNFAYVKWLTPR